MGESASASASASVFVCVCLSVSVPVPVSVSVSVPPARARAPANACYRTPLSALCLPAQAHTAYCNVCACVVVCARGRVTL